MKIYLLSQDYVNGWDTYDSAIVIAENETDARNIHPSGFVTHVNNNQWMGTYSGGNNIGGEYEYTSSDWVEYCDIDKISVKYIGEASKDQVRGLVLASFNAG